MERFSIKTLLLSAASRYFDLHLVSDRLFSQTVVDEADCIICPIRSGSKRIKFLRFLSQGVKAMEAAVPLTRANETLMQLDRFLAGHRRMLLLAVGLRTSPADSFSLSPCYGRDVFWVDLFYKNEERFVDGLRGLLEGLDARCHWGKHIGLSAGYLRQQYPRLEEFRQTRAVLDPDRIFCNTFTRSLDL
jgi:FAD/FMN-containing dehydrogenase